MAELARCGALGVLGRPFGFREGPPGAREECASGFGELHLAGRSSEQIDPDFALELSDRGAERRLGDVTARRRG